MSEVSENATVSLAVSYQALQRLGRTTQEEFVLADLLVMGLFAVTAVEATVVRCLKNLGSADEDIRKLIGLKTKYVAWKGRVNPTSVGTFDDEINALGEFRNSIAHGDADWKSISFSEVKLKRDESKKVIQEIHEAHRNYNKSNNMKILRRETTDASVINARKHYQSELAKGGPPPTPR